MPRKAALLKRLARAGARDFYEGETAALLVEDLAAGGSRIAAADLAAYRAEWGAPLVRAYRDYDAYAPAGLSGGPSFLDACDHVLQSNIGAETSDANAALIYATAIRDAYDKRWRTMGHAASNAGCTSHVSVVDAEGTMVSLTNTLLSRFGSKVVLPRAGFLMNNGVMWFDPQPGRPNSIAAGAKPLANMCPIILTRSAKPALAMGAAGGRTIFPALVQIMSGLIDRGWSLEDAFHAARIDASAPTVKINAKADPAVAATVAARHPVEIVEDTLYPVNFAIPSAVMRDPDGAGYIGMAHPTSPWAAVATA